MTASATGGAGRPRHGLQTMKHPLPALERNARAKNPDEGVVLTETQVATLERKRDDEEASREIETAHPGYLGAQTTAALPAVGC